MNGIQVFFRLCPFKPKSEDDQDIITYLPGKPPLFKIVHPKLSIQEQVKIVSYNISDIDGVFRANVDNLEVYKNTIHKQLFLNRNILFMV